MTAADHEHQQDSGQPPPPPPNYGYGQPSPPYYRPPPQYPQGPPPMAAYPGPLPYAPPKQNGLGIASLVLGIASFFCYVLSIPVAITGLALGIANLRRLRDGRADNKTMTWWGIWLSIAALVLSVIVIIVVIAVAVHDAHNGTIQ